MPAPRLERIVLVAGVACASLALALISATAIWDPTAARLMLGQAIAHAFVGREAAMLASLSLGTPVWLVGGLAVLEDLTVLLVGYALFLGVARGALRLPFLARFERSAPSVRQARRTETVGTLLLAAALWVPAFPSGALTAALVARALQYRPSRFLPIIAASAAMADVGYVLGARQLARFVDLRWMALLALVVVATVAIATLVARRRQRAA